MNLDILDYPFELNSEQIDFYRESSFIKLKEVFTPEVINFFNLKISDRVERLKKVEAPLEQRDTYGKAFLQLFNLWTQDEIIKKLIFSKRMAKIAMELMGTNGVRLYHDQALFKEVGGGITPWHADQYYWPLSTDKAITVWIPLQKTSLEMGPLEFSKGSHTIVSGRELPISDESEIRIKRNLKINNFEHVIEPFDIGEVSFHSGWIFHRAGANTSDQVRKVMTIIYIDRDMTMKKPENKGQQNDANTWCPDVKVGEIIQSPLNPLLYEK